MYSRDRKQALDMTISCLQDMPLYDQCQKTLVVDGRNNYWPDGWLIVEVPRLDGFCWASMWDAGVSVARHPVILYLDSDRLWPSNLLQEIVDKIDDGKFLFTTHHFLMSKELPIEKCKEFLRTFADDSASLTRPPYLGNVKFDPRFSNCSHRPGKNVMSGGTAFTKSTYLRLGGVDGWYCGHGAYADTDFHFTAQLGGCEFVDLRLPELHWPHPKLNDKGQPLDQMALHKLSLDNYIYYCKKWRLPMAMAESLASDIGIKRPDVYVAKRAKELQ